MNNILPSMSKLTLPSVANIQHNPPEKKQKTTRDCFLCEKSHRKCDGNRPCSACISMGMPQICMGASNPKASQQHPSSSSSSSSSTTTTPSTASITKPQPIPHIPSHSSSSSSSASSHSHSHSSSSTTTSSAPVPFSTPSHYRPPKRAPSLISSSPPPITELSAPESLGSSPTALIPHSALLSQSFSTPSPGQIRQLPQSQLEWNQLLLRKLAEIQNNQQQIQIEMLNLRLENMTLKSQIKCLTEGTELEGVMVPHASQLGSSMDQPTVVYNLSEMPPKVAWANESFCNLLGYTQAEVQSQPWHRFIHSDYIDRTQKMIFQAAEQRSAGLEFDQVYVDKLGATFIAHDSHYIINGPTGVPMADHVRITVSNMPGLYSRPMPQREAVPLLSFPASSAAHHKAPEPASHHQSDPYPDSLFLDGTDVFPPSTLPTAGPRTSASTSPIHPNLSSTSQLPFPSDSTPTRYLIDDSDISPWSNVPGASSPLPTHLPDDVYNWILNDDDPSPTHF